jgi:hypothetical protein
LQEPAFTESSAESRSQNRITYGRVKTSSPDEIISSISTAINTLRRLRKDIPVVVTVSAVPIYRSFLTPFALVDDCMPKAALRPAVPAILERNEGVYYWPSFKLFRWFGSYIEPAFGEDDLLPRHPNLRLVGTK